MLTPEQFIYDLQAQVIRLEKELEEAQKDIKDFEVLAIEWKKSYGELERKHKVKMAECEQIIKELEYELRCVGIFND